MQHASPGDNRATTRVTLHHIDQYLLIQECPLNKKITTEVYISQLQRIKQIEIKMALQYDDALESVGAFGRYQKFVFFLGQVFSMGCCMVNLCYVYIAALPNHWCHVPGLEGLGLSDEEIRNLTVPNEVVDGVEKNSHCKMYDVNYENLTFSDAYQLMSSNRSVSQVKCQDGWDYDTSQYRTSISMDWDLVCDDRPLAAMTQSVFMAGLMVGVVSCGFIADVIGRKWALRVTVVMTVLTAIMSSFSVNLYMFLVLRFMIAFAALPVFTVFFVMVMELVGPDWRLFVGVVVEYSWVLGYFVIVMCAYFIRQWRYLQLALSVPLIIYFPVLYFMPESPRWLYSKGRRDEADDLMRNIAEKNGKTIPSKWDVTIMDTQSVYLWSILKYPRLRCRAFIMFFVWCVCSLVYYGLSLGASNLGGDDYVSFLISGAIEFPAYVFCHLTMDRIGRRWCLSGTLLLGGISLLLTMAVPSDPGLEWVLITLTTIGKFGISAAFAIVYIFTAELFPTVVRSSGLGASSFCARIGGIVAPQMALLGEYSKFIPLITFGVLSLVAGLLSLLLPETSNCKMPETLEDAEQFGRKKPKLMPDPSNAANKEAEENPVHDSYI